MPGNGHTKAPPDLPIEGRRRGGTEGTGKARDVDVRNANEMRTVEEGKRADDDIALQKKKKNVRKRKNRSNRAVVLHF